MKQVIIGVDPHKLSATIEVVDGHERVLATGRFGTDKPGMPRCARPHRGGRRGSGRSRAATVPVGHWRNGCWPTASTWSTCRPSCRHGRGCWTPGKTDAHDAHAVAVPAVRTPGLRKLSYDVELEALRMLVDRREELTRAKVQADPARALEQLA
jgi:transposase